MNFGKLFSLLMLLTFSLVGCEAVSSLHPVGNQPVKTPVDQWQGAWLAEGGVLHTKVMNAEKGELLLIIVNTEKDISNLIEKHSVLVRKTGNNYYFNIVDKEHEGQYFFAKFIRDGNTIKAYTPSYKSIADKIRAGQLKGTIDKSDSFAVLTGTRADINNYVESHPETFSNKDILLLEKIIN